MFCLLYVWFDCKRAKVTMGLILILKLHIACYIIPSQMCDVAMYALPLYRNTITTLTVAVATGI